MYIPETQKLTLPSPGTQGDGFPRASTLVDAPNVQQAQRELKRRLRVMEAGVTALQERCEVLIDDLDDGAVNQHRNALHLHARLQSLHTGIRNAVDALARLEQSP